MLLTDYEDLIDSLALPDPDDRHVLAAAIRAGAQTIITFNLKDFPKAALVGISERARAARIGPGFEVACLDVTRRERGHLGSVGKRRQGSCHARVGIVAHRIRK